MRRPFIIVFLALVLAFRLQAQTNPAAEAQPTQPPLSADTEFKTALQFLSSADEARDAGHDIEASRLYAQAMETHTKFSEKYPDWQRAVVQFRISYCNNQLEALMKRIHGTDLQNGEFPEHTSESQSSRPVGSLAEFKNAAGRSLARGETEKARSLLLEALRLEPDDAAVRLLMGIAQCQAGEYPGALQVTDQLIADFPSNAPALVLRGAINMAKGDRTQARIDLARSLLINPNLKEAHYDLTQLFVTDTPPNFQAAREHYTRVIELGGTPDRNLEFLLKLKPDIATNAPAPSVAQPATGKPK